MNGDSYMTEMSLTEMQSVNGGQSVLGALWEVAKKIVKELSRDNIGKPMCVN